MQKEYENQSRSRDSDRWGRGIDSWDPKRWDAIGECVSLKTWDVFGMNRVQMIPNVLERWQEGGKLRCFHISG